VTMKAARLALVAALFVPLVIQLADEVTSHSLAKMIEGEADSDVPLWRRMGIDLAVGLVLGVISALVAMALLQILKEDILISAGVSAAIALTVLVLTLAGALVLPFMRRKDGGWRVSSSAVDGLMKTLGIGLYMTLAVVLSKAFGG
jgi:Mg/Co/Ni transporter MgtE